MLSSFFLSFVILTDNSFLSVFCLITDLLSAVFLHLLPVLQLALRFSPSPSPSLLLLFFFVLLLLNLACIAYCVLCVNLLQ